MGPDASVQDALETAIAKLQPDPDEEHLLRQLTYHQYGSPSGADLNQLSMALADEGTGFRGLDRVITAGYSALIEKLAENHEIRFGEIVQNVDTSGSQVQVNTQNSVFVADAVVVTVPLGVLKAGSIAFTPGLPLDKQGAINRLGMGSNHKLVLLFDEVFWDNTDIFVYLRPDIGRSPAFFNLHRTTGLPALVMWHGGRASTTMEARSKRDVAADALEALEVMYG